MYFLLLLILIQNEGCFSKIRDGSILDLKMKRKLFIQTKNNSNKKSVYPRYKLLE